MQYLYKNQIDRKCRYHLNKNSVLQSTELRWNIYLVDDDLDDLMLSEKVLHSSGQVHDIYTVEVPEMLFEVMNDHGHMSDLDYYDVIKSIILMDIHMPELNGIQMLEQLKSHPCTSDCPVILLTEDSSGFLVEEAYHYGADGYLEKPINLIQFHHNLELIKKGNKSLCAGGNFIV